MNSFEFEAYQCFSRPSVEIAPFRAVSTAENPFKWDVTFEVTPRNESVAFAELFGRPPSIGAGEFHDADLEHYLGLRWPVWLVARGRVSGDMNWQSQNGGLWFARNLLWLHRSSFPQDQVASDVGYRREFLRAEDRDIVGVSRPSLAPCDAPSDRGEPSGLGLVRIPGLHSPGEVAELIWSEILTIPGRTNYKKDKRSVDAALAKRHRHYRVYSELRDSRGHLARGDIKATVRSAGPAVEGALRYFMSAKKVRLPKFEPGQKFLSFTEKIELGLSLGGAPSFAQLEPDHSRALGYLYKARSSSHDVDRTYTDETGKKKRINNTTEIAGWVDSAHVFVHWIDTLV